LRGQTDSEFPGWISLKDFFEAGESVARRGHSQPLEVEFVFCSFDNCVDWFMPCDGMSNAETSCPPPLAFLFGTVLSLFKSFVFFIALQLFSQCWDLLGD